MSPRFYKANLRGKSFKKGVLNGEDFCGADIRGADFTDAVLIGANFSEVKTGLTPTTIFILFFVITVLIFLIGIVMGYASAFPVFIINLLAEDSTLGKQVLVIIGSVILASFMIVIVRQGLGNALGILAILLAAFTGIVGFAGTGDLLAAAWVQAVMIAIAVASVLLGALAIAILLAILDFKLLPIPIIVAIFGVVLGVLEGIKKPTDMIGLPTHIELAIAGVIGVVFLSISVHISLRSLARDRRYKLIHTLTINLCTLFGTKFRGANLIDVNFTKSTIPYTDFREAILKRTNWFQVNGLERSRIEGTYLDSSEIRQLVISKNGENCVFDYENLRGINLENAILENASFVGSDLSESNLKNADLTKAKLAEAQLYGSDLSNACLTKACIQDWAISTDTKFDNVECSEIYMRLPTGGDPDPWRKPDNRHETFKQGDFTDFIAPIIKTLALYRQQNVDPRQVGNALKTLDLYHYGGINASVSAIALMKIAEENPDAGLEVVALEGRGEEKIHLQAVITGKGDGSKLSAEYADKYSEILSLPPKEIQSLLTLIAEKDNRIHSLEKILSTPKEGNNVYYIQAGRDISGVLNMGTISGNVRNEQQISPT